MDNIDCNFEASDSIRDSTLVNNDVEKNLLEKDSTVEPLEECSKAVAGSKENISEVNTSTQEKTSEETKIEAEIQNVDHTKLDIGTENLAAKKVNKKRKRIRKRRRKKKAAKANDETQNMGQVDGILNLHLSDGNFGEGIDVPSPMEVGLRFIPCQGQLSNQHNQMATENLMPENGLHEVSDEIIVYEGQCSVQGRKSILATERQLSNHPNQIATDNPKPMDGLDVANDEIIVYEGRYSAQRRSIFFTGGVEVARQISTFSMGEAEYLSRIPLIPSIKRKLIVLDVNGLLANIVMPAPKGCRGDVHILGRAIFKRPFCDDFLKFCFQNFDVGVWSSRSKYFSNIDALFLMLLPDIYIKTQMAIYLFDLSLSLSLSLSWFKVQSVGCLSWIFLTSVLLSFHINFNVFTLCRKIIDRVVEYLFGDLKGKLLFCWDMSHSTQTGFNTLENIHKPLVLKELRRIWENDDPNLPWKSVDYNESNTLLLDDSPYKALLNPLHTAIFPTSFDYKNRKDNSLGPGGDLRVYLEGLLTSGNVQEYVEQHPFGQGAINETNLSWDFYLGVLRNMSNRLQNDTPSCLTTI